MNLEEVECWIDETDKKIKEIEENLSQLNYNFGVRITKLENLTKHNSSSKKDCSFCKGKSVNIISQEGNNLGKTKCPKCSPS